MTASASSPSSTPASSADAPTVAYVGLGVMGASMAGHLVRAGYRVRAYNRTAAKAQAWLDGVKAKHPGAHASIHANPAEAAQGASLVFCCVGNDADLTEVLIGPQGALPSLQAGAVIVDHTTTSATAARAMNEAALQRSCAFVDAPVSGGNIGAINGSLSVMCGGSEQAFELARAAIASYSKVQLLLGPSGSGQLAKMVNQICVAGVVQGLAEGLAFGQRAGLDMDRVLQLISQGAAQSWQMVNRGPTMLKDEFDFGFAVDWMHKDLGLCLQQAESLGARLPVTQLIDQYYAQLQAMGGGRWDTSSLIRLLR